MFSRIIPGNPPTINSHAPGRDAAFARNVPIPKQREPYAYEEKHRYQERDEREIGGSWPNASDPVRPDAAEGAQHGPGEGQAKSPLL
jgi:hypothetical protein